MTDESQTRIAELVGKSDVVLFMKGSPLFPQCGFSSRAIAILNHIGVEFDSVDVLQDQGIRQGIKAFSDWPTIPPALRQGRVCRRVRHHDGNVRKRRACNAARRRRRREGQLMPGRAGRAVRWPALLKRYRSACHSLCMPRANLVGCRDRVVSMVKRPALVPVSVKFSDNRC